MENIYWKMRRDDTDKAMAALAKAYASCKKEPDIKDIVIILRKNEKT
jgi:hypothetical protein